MTTRAFPTGLALLLPLGVLAALSGSVLVASFGTAGNPGIAGVLAGMALARLPGAVFRPFAAPQAQAMAHAVAAAAGIGAGQALLLPIGIPFVMGRADLVAPMLLGAFLALLVDGWLMWRLFGSPAYPAEAAWPQGAAAAAVIRAGTEGDRPGATVLAGMATGLCGAFYGAPMAAFGVALLGNAWALGMFAAGVLLRAHGAPLLGWLGPGGDLMQAQVPQGMLVGATVVALGQMLRPALRGPDRPARATWATAAAAHLAIALLLALAGGLHAAMPPAMLVAFVAFAAAAALLHALVVGLAAMHAGWLPSLAAAMIVVALGLPIGFPPEALALLAGYSVATGPGFAAMAQALKAARDLDGDAQALRRQAAAVLLAFVLAGAVVWLVHGRFFEAGLVAPAGRVFAIAIRAGDFAGVAGQLAMWAVVGAALQLAGGTWRQLGVMLAAGMLLLSPAVGWAVLVGLAVRALLLRRGDRYREAMGQFGAGTVAGDALFLLADLLGRASWRR